MYGRGYVCTDIQLKSVDSLSRIPTYQRFYSYMHSQVNFNIS